MSALPVSAVKVIQAPEQAVALLHPLRRRIMEELRAPGSAAGLAKRIGLARQKVNYHLRELEAAGLLEAVGERRKGNCVERIVQATASHYLISPEALGDLGADPSQIKDRFSWAYLVSVAAKAVRDLAVLRKRADRVKKQLPTFTLQTEIRFASAAELNAFAEGLSNEVARLAAKHHDERAPEGRPFTFFIGAYPTMTKTEEEAEAAAREADAAGASGGPS